MMEHEQDNAEEATLGRIQGDQLPADPESRWMRLLHVILVAMMVSLAVNILFLVTVIQFVITLINKGEINENLAEFGEDLGIWIAKAARYMTAASRVKPWPWTEID